MLRGALIGCGFFAANHLNAWRDVEGAEIVALCDRDPARLRGGGRAVRHRAGPMPTRARCWRPEELDFVDIATTVASHRPLVELAAGGGRPHDLPEALRELDGRRRARWWRRPTRPGATLMVHENFRWQSAIRRAQAEMAPERSDGRSGAG